MNATIQTLEPGARDLLNAGLGLFRTVETRLNELQAGLAANYTSLVNRGAADASPEVKKLHGLLDEGFARLREIQERVSSAVKLG